MSDIQMNEGGDMDAFKELMTRSPDMEVMNIDELHGMVFWAGAATKWARMQIELAKKVGGLQEQIAAWRKDGQAAAELDFKATQRLGEIAREEPQVRVSAGSDSPRSSGGRFGEKSTSPSNELPKWQRLGFSSETAMKEAQYLASHSKEAQEIIEEAKANDDFPSRTAVKNKVKANKAEERARERREAKPSMPDINDAALSVVIKLDECYTKIIALYEHKEHLSDFNRESIEYAAEKIYNITKGE